MSRINTNITSITANHRLQTNQADLSTHLARLSSGLRINSGKDDPAGLIASETLRSEIRGISQAIDNSTRASNVLSTAEGALNEVSSLLLDMRALVTHAANEGANSPDEQAADQLSIDSILQSIDRISNTTQFGGKKLLDGSMGYTLSGAAAANFTSVGVFGANVPPGTARAVMVETVSAASRALFKPAAGVSHTLSNVSFEIKGKLGAQVFTFGANTTAATMQTAINKTSDLTGVSAVLSGTCLTLRSTAYGSDEFVSVNAIQGTLNGNLTPGSATVKNGVDAMVNINGQAASVNGLTATVRANGLDATIQLTATKGTTKGIDTFYVTGGGAKFQLGSEVDPNGQISMGIQSIGTTALGNNTLGFLSTIGTGKTNSIDNDRTAEAEKIVVESINQVAVLRGRIGAVQKNQIETNINSQKVALENVQAAESAIRDADMATEVAAMTRSQILVQSTTSILGIANQQPQSVLSLLQ
jgi:flagellin